MVTKLYNINRKEAINLYENNCGEYLWNHYPKRPKIKLFNRKQETKELFISSTLCGDNKSDFKEIFGKQKFCYTTWYKGWVWFLIHDGLIISITSSIRGTDYRYYNDKELTKKQIYGKIKSFVDELYEKLNK